MAGTTSPVSQPPSPVPFAFKDHQIRTVVNGDGKPWFVAKDVCAALTVPWRGQETLRLIPVEWVGVRKLRTPNDTARGGLRGDITVIAEPAVYKLAFRSNKPEADEFTNWVASEVLPAIRKTGGFQAALPTGHLSPDQQQHIRNLVAARAKALPHGGGFPQIWERVKNRFGVARYQDIPAAQFEAVVEYLLKMEVKREEPKALPAPSAPTPMGSILDECAGIMSAARRIEAALFNRRTKIGTLRRDGSTAQVLAERRLREIDDPLVRYGVRMIETGMDCLVHAAETTEALATISRGR